MTEYKPTKILMLPFDDAAGVVDHWFGEAFNKPQPGVYIKGEELPRERLQGLYLGQPHELWQESGDPLNSVQDINSPVYNRDDQCLITAVDLWKGWDHYPSVPFAARVIVEQYMRDAMNSQLRYLKNKRFRFTQVLETWIMPQYVQDSRIGDRIETMLQEMVMQTMQFMNGPTFDMHLMTRKLGDLAIEKYDDWRVYEYYKLVNQPYQAR